MPTQRLSLIQGATASSTGTATFTFPAPATNLVYLGTLVCNGAPAGATFIATVGGTQWGTWNGTAVGGPIQALPGEQIQISATGLTAATTYNLQWIGRSDSLSETSPAYPDTNGGGGTVSQPPGTTLGVTLVGGASQATATNGSATTNVLLGAPAAGTAWLLHNATFTVGSGATAVQIVGHTSGFIYAQAVTAAGVATVALEGQIAAEALDLTTTGGGGSVWLSYDLGSSTLTVGGGGGGSSGGGGGGGGTSVGGNAIYGDGSDGAVTFDGTTTILGLVPSASTYTLTRDIFLQSSTINLGVTIKLHTFRLFCQGTLTNNGTISDSGTQGGDNAAGVGSGGLSAQNVHSPYEIAAGGILYSSNGGNASSGGAGSAGQTLATFSFQLGGLGGTAGSGSAGAGGAGGAGGTAPPVAGDVGGMRWLGAAMGYWPSTHSLFSIGSNTFVAGSGGGGGSGDGANNPGGGGGGGGIVTIFARSIAGTGAIQARGGRGGNTTAGNCGGGGGGGGGVVIIISGSVTLGSPNSIAGQTIDANGGIAGASHGTGTAASAGTNGTVVLIPN